MGYNPKRINESYADSMIMSIVKLDASVVTEVRCLVEKRKRRGNRQK